MDVAAFIEVLNSQRVLLSVNGDKLRVEYDEDAELTEAIRSQLKHHKQEIISYLLQKQVDNHLESNNNQFPNRSIPASFYERSCAHCGRIGQARRRSEDGTWLCICYFERPPLDRTHPPL